MEGKVGPSGSLGLQLIHSDGGRTWVTDPLEHRRPRLRELAPDFMPRRGLPQAVNEYRLANLRNVWRGARRVAAANALRLPTMYGVLRLSLIRENERLDLGIVSLRVVTTAGVNFIVDAFQNTVELENFIYHGFGTGTNAEAVGDTALQTELTTQYAADNTRPTGSNTEGASANIYRTVGTLDPDSAVAITEHGVFSQAATGGGTLLDRSVFSVVNVAATGDTLQATYDLTLTAGS